jgi:hypothetical protein
MSFRPCGCVICKNNLGELTNELANEGYTLKEIIENLKSQRLNIDKKIVLRHLNAYNITLEVESVNIENVNRTPVNIDLKSFDFSKYDFDIKQPVSIISYLQKLHLKIHLNQAELLLKYQNDVLCGDMEDVPSDALKNIGISWKLLSEVSGINVYVNQQNAIRTVESMGLIISGQENILEDDNDV